MSSASLSASATGRADLPAWARDGSGRRIAVLGADGFIGSRVVCTALAAGAHVTAICVKHPWRLGGSIGDPRLAVERVHRGCWWTNEALASLVPLLSSVDAVVLLYYRPPTAAADGDRLDEELRINAVTAGRIARAAADVRARLVFASSADVYGPWHDDPVTEETTPRPVTPYAKAKLEAEGLIAEAFGSGESYLCLRIATAYGPGENGPRAIPSFVRAFRRGELPVVHGDGTDVRDYVYVGDVATAAWNAAIGSAGAGGVVNIGSGVGRSTLAVLREVAAATGTEPVARHEPSSRPPSCLVLDPRRARRTLGFVPRSDFVRVLGDEVLWLLKSEPSQSGRKNPGIGE